MTSRTIVTVECDGIHFGDPVDARPVELAALGYAVEVDLCDAHEQELRDVVEQYVAMGRPVGKVRRPRTVKPAAPTVSAVPDLTGRQASLTCPECGGNYRGPQGLSAHRRAAHALAGDAPRARRRAG